MYVCNDIWLNNATEQEAVLYEAMKENIFLMTLIEMFNYQLYNIFCQKLKKINMSPICMLFVIIK